MMKKEKCDRYLIFCPSIKLCSEVYTMLRLELSSCIKFVQMFHSQTVEAVKDDIKKDLGDAAGRIRVLVATSAAGMGVNFKDISHVINYGVPKNMDCFVQQLGRAGRDRSHATAILLFNGHHCKGIDSDMNEYVLNKDKCRRQVILKSYNNTDNGNVVAHSCCDICEAKCVCGTDECTSFKHPFYEMLENQEYSSSSSSDNETESCDSDFC